MMKMKMMERWCYGCDDWTNETIDLKSKCCLGCGKELTHSYTYFSIVSQGELGTYGHESSERGVFDPDEVTQILGIEPFRKFKQGEYRKNVVPNTPQAKYRFSRWSGEKSEVARYEANEQCLDTIKHLKHKIPELLEIKKHYQVYFYLSVVPHIFNEESPSIHFDKSVIEFCYLTGTEIVVDTCVYGKL